MPSVSKGTKGPAGVYKVKFGFVPDEPLPAKDNFPAAVKVGFEGGEGAALAVPLNDPERAIRLTRAFLSRPMTATEATGIGAMQEAILQLAVQDEMWVEVYNGWVQRFLAPPGTYIGRLADVFRQKGIPGFYEYQGENRNTKALETIRKTRLYLEVWNGNTPTGLLTGVDFPWKIAGKMGKRGADDGISYSEKSTAWRLLRILGFSWERFEAEVKDARSLYDREDEPGMMGNVENLVPFFFEKTLENAATVQWVVVASDKDGSPMLLKEGEFKEPHIIPVVVVGNTTDEFAEERQKLLAILDEFTSLAAGHPATWLDATGKNTTPEAKAGPVKILVKLVRENYPSLALKKREDGSAFISANFDKEAFAVDAIVALALVFERAVACLKSPVDSLEGISDLTNVDRFFEWLENEPVKGALEAVGKEPEEL